MLFQFVLDQLPVVVENLIANRTHPVVTLVTGQVLKANKAESHGTIIPRIAINAVRTHRTIRTNNTRIWGLSYPPSKKYSSEYRRMKTQKKQIPSLSFKLISQVITMTILRNLMLTVEI